MSALESFFRALLKEVVVDAVELAVEKLRTPTANLVSQPAANDDSAAEANAAIAATAEGAAELREECRAIINQLAPTHGPQLRAMFAEFSVKRLSEVEDQHLPDVLEKLEGLKNAG